MAGRPVASRGGGGMLYGLITFVILAVAGIGGFVWQLTTNQALADNAERSEKKIKQIGNPPAYYMNEATARGSSASAVMSSDLEDLAFLITGKRDAVRPAILDASNQLLERITKSSPDAINAGDSLHAALSNMQLALQSTQQENANLRAQVDELRQANQLLEAGAQQVREEFAQQVSDLNDEVTQIRTQTAEQLAAKDEQLAAQQAEGEALNEELSRLKVERQRNERDRDIDMQRMQNDLEAMREQVRIYKPGGFDPYDILKKADGRVLRSIPGSDVIYIDAGRDNHIRPGLKFEVFSPTADAAGGDFRGKASVEVTAISDTTAECRVTRQAPGRPIVEGDIVVNIAYERNRRPKFVVRGDFDLDYDGKVDWNGSENVTAIVEAWGGEVADEVSETTDFLVLGMGPTIPSLAGEGPTSDVIRSLADTRLDQLEKFEGDIETARTRYIPVITQSQLLFLTGYSGTGPILAE